MCQLMRDSGFDLSLGVLVRGKFECEQEPCVVSRSRVSAMAVNATSFSCCLVPGESSCRIQSPLLFPPQGVRLV